MKLSQHSAKPKVLVDSIAQSLGSITSFTIDEGTNDRQLTIAYAGSRVAIVNAVTDALALLKRDSLFSAGAILRRAFEITYVNVLLVRRR